MPLHNEIEINCKKGATTECQNAGVKYMGQGVYVRGLFVLSDLS